MKVETYPPPETFVMGISWTSNEPQWESCICSPCMSINQRVPPTELMYCNALQRLLHEHAPGSLLPFMFWHGRAAAACELVFPPANGFAEDSSNTNADTQ